MVDGRSGADPAHLTAATAHEASEEGAALARSANELVAEGAGGARLLPMVLSDVPVAVLLVDVRAGDVTYANRAAVAMAGDLQLPAAVDDWTRSAGLLDPAGEAIAGTDVSLLRIAGQGQTGGMTVRLQTARHGDRRLLWATGFPLRELDSDRALVILFEVAAEDAGGTADRGTLQEQAIVATNIAFTISDPRRDDNPLVWVNPAFTAITGYPTEEALGRNCRFLQGPATDRQAVADIREALGTGDSITRVLLNYRKDGTAFWNQVAISPVVDGAGDLVSFVGVQTDVTERVRADAERDAAYAEARAAGERLQLLAEATGALVGSLDVRDALTDLARMVVPALADWVVFVTASDDEDGRIEDVVIHHVDGMGDVLEGCEEVWRNGLGAGSMTRSVINGASPILAERFDDADAAAALGEGPLLELCKQLGLTSAVFVPLLSRHRRTLGSMAFVSGRSGRVWDENDLEIAADVGRRAGLSVDNARLYQREHRAAVTLQRSLLPAAPSIEGLTVATRYLPANTAADVGGDVYEVMDLADGSYGIAVGDVIGHDLTAAAAMGQLRVLLRTLAWDRSSRGTPADPAEVLSRADEVLQSLAITPMATAFFARLDRPTEPGGDWGLTYSNAGHPPTLVRRPDGSVESLSGEADVLLGVTTRTERESARRSLSPGSVLVAYTDGLVEQPGEDLGQALEELRRLLEDYPVGTTPGVIVDALTARLGGSLRDDVALLAIGID